MALFTEKNMEPLFAILKKCEGVKQREEFHPEKDLLEHSLQCFYQACKYTNDVDLILAALFHDVGKIKDSKGHEQYGVEMLEDYLSVKSLWLIENHMRIWYFLLGGMKKYSKVKIMMDHPFLPELAALARFDKTSRIAGKSTVFDKCAIIDMLNKKVDKRFEEQRDKIKLIRGDTGDGTQG